MESTYLSPETLLRHILQNPRKDGGFDMEEYFRPMIDYITADESWKRAIPCTFDFRSVLYIIFYAGFIVGFHMMISLPAIARHLPTKVKNIKSATITAAFTFLPLVVYCYYSAVMRIIWRRQKKRLQFLKRQALVVC